MTNPQAQAAMVGELRSLLEKATPGEWQVQDGCSWRRIGTRWHNGDVLRPTNSPTDGHPDLAANDGRRTDNLNFIVAAHNQMQSLLDLLEAQQRRIEALEGELFRQCQIAGSCEDIVCADTGSECCHCNDAFRAILASLKGDRA